MLCILFIIILICLLLTITIKPFAFLFSHAVSLMKVQGNIGPYEKCIENIQVKHVDIQVEGLPDVHVEVYDTDDNIKPLIIYIHGGGWVSGNAKQIAWYAKLLASNGYTVANVDYCLAPKYPYPASTLQLSKVIDYFYEQADDYHIDANKIFLAGNSAGAHLSSQLSAIYSNKQLAGQLNITPQCQIAGVILYNGVYDFDTAGDCGFPMFKKLLWAYTNKKDYLNYERLDEISTIKNITEDYPPTFITVGDHDPLKQQTLDFIEKLKSKNVEVESVLWTDSKLGHDYIYLQNKIEAQTAYKKTIAFLNSKS